MRLPVRPTQSVFVFAAIIIVAIVASVALLLRDMRERELSHARLETTSVLQMLMQQTQQNFDSADLVVQAIQERMSSPYGRQLALDGAPTHLLLSVRASGLPQIGSIFVVDAQGELVNWSGGFPAQKKSVADRDYYTAFANAKGQERGSFHIDRPVRSRMSGGWTVHLARALENPDGSFRGVVVVAMSIPQFELGYNLMKLDYVRPIALYMEDGTLVASLPHREGIIGSAAPELNREILPNRQKEIRSIRHRAGNGGYEVFAIGHLDKYPLLVGVTDDEVLSLASWREDATPIVVGAILMCGFTLLVAMILTRNLMQQENLSQALHVATNRYQHTVDSVMDAIVAVDEAMNIVLFNPAAERMFGREAEDTLGKPLDALLPGRLHQSHHVHIDRMALAANGTQAMRPQFQATGLRADGSEFPLESTVSRSIIGGDVQWTAVLRDVTERRRAETELRELNAQLRGLSASLQHVREEERTRISRELHDELGQQLTGLKLSLSWLGNRLKEGRAASPEMVDEMRHMLVTSIASVRRISTELRPPVLDDLGFGDAVRWLAREFEKRSEFKVELDLQGTELVVGDELATALFRIVQESLTNVVRHAAASKVQIGLVIQDESLVLRVVDNGRGFCSEPGKGGIGLLSMRERANAIGAQFKISSDPSTGSVIEVSVALDALAAEGEEA